MPRRLEHRNICELLAGLDASQHESTAAHIAAPGEFCWHRKALTENCEQWLYIFRSRDASQKHNVTVHARNFRECARVTFERFSIACIRQIDVAGRNFLQTFEGNASIWRD